MSSDATSSGATSHAESAQADREWGPPRWPDDAEVKQYKGLATATGSSSSSVIRKLTAQPPAIAASALAGGLSGCECIHLSQ